MEDQQEIGGAQALLLLGTKDSKIDDEHDHLEGEPGNTSQDVGDMLEEKENQQLNDAVEAAVMRYVGGTLESDEHLHGGHGSDPEHDMGGNNDHDNSVLEASGALSESLGPKRRIHDEIMSNLSEYQWDRFLEADVAADLQQTPPGKRRHKNFALGHDIDPELAGLDTEHDQLVHAAILGAGELAKELAGQKNEHEHDERHSNNAHDLQNDTMENIHDNGAAINQLAHAAALLGGLKPSSKRRPLKKAESAEPHGLSLKYDHLSIESLIDQAAGEALTWYNTHGEAGMGPRPFSREEIQIVENFVDGYCRLNHVSREDVCRRVWCNERTKDDFWESVTKVLPYRLRASVYKHVRRQYHVFDIRARWTPEEDALLRKLAVSCATNWKKVGEMMHRMPEDCRDRWRNYVKCGENRASNKWSESEEHTLRTIVVEMLKEKPDSINWTLVSERMQGTRLRIQCRYKWNKLLRREQLQRVAHMDAATRLWLCNRVLDADVSDADAVDWEYLAHVYHAEHKKAWSAQDLKVGFERMLAQVRDHKNLPLAAVVAKAMAAVYDDMKQEKLVNMVEMKGLGDAAAVANAAVAAVVPTDLETLLYTLWR